MDYPARIAELSTPHLADACLMAGIPVRCGPASLRPVVAQAKCSGRVFPVRHVGSVDVFLEAFERASPEDLLVVDNEGRVDEACVGDLVALEALNAGIRGIVIWGLHRDTAELANIGLPVFSLGVLPTGPQRLDPRSPDSMEWARIGAWVVTAADYVACDCDGILFLPTAGLDNVLTIAEGIAERERTQAEKMRAGTSLRQQTQFARYLSERQKNPKYGFREHLKATGRAIEA